MPESRYPWLAGALAQGGAVITGSRRLARHLAIEVAERELAAGRAAWATPAIHEFDDWCSAQIANLADTRTLPLLIDGFCSSIVWELLLRKQGTVELPAIGGLVRQAREAWRRTCDWNVPLPEVRAAARSEDEQWFAAAAVAYAARLHDESWVDRAGMPAVVADLCRTGKVCNSGHLTFAGFDRFTPAVRAVMDALTEAGCKLNTVSGGKANDNLALLRCLDGDAEMRTAGAWARQQLERDPTASIAIVNPVLQVGADRAARLVREGLAPGWQYGGDDWRHSVNVSYGRRLADFPAIADALALLRWIHHGLSSSDISLLLRSRSLGGTSLAVPGRLELSLRQLPDRAWTPAALQRALEQAGQVDMPRPWRDGVGLAMRLADEQTGMATPAAWAGHIDSYLAAWGWPGPQALGSEAFQLVNRWRDLLNELAASATVGARITFREAVERVTTRAADIVFQPETGVGAVELLGTLEASGLQFDHLWISGLHAGQWPGNGNASPFLSRRLQKEYGMPDATPADTLAFSRTVLERLAGSASTCVFSWPRNDGESELSASSLLESMPCNSYEGVADPGWHAGTFRDPGALIVARADPVPPVAAGERIRGGAYTVQRQAVEPLQAFVFGRLGLRDPGSFEAGISPGLRGNIIHAALCELFADCPTQAQIGAWSPDAVVQRLGSAIDTALGPHVRFADPTLTRMLALERTRVFHLLREFLVQELERPDFGIEAVEGSLDYAACGVHLKLRVDRIDRLRDGSLLVIDYKTGAPRSLQNRQGELRDLQLVVYADALEASIGGLALINLNGGEIRYSGAGGDQWWAAGQSADWPAQLATWQATMRAAMERLAAGDVRINLQQPVSDSRPLAILSRIEEQKRAGR